MDSIADKGTMSFREEVERIREHYVQKYFAALHEYQTKGANVATEIQGQINSEEASRGFYLGCSRLDIIIIEPLQAVEVHCSLVSPNQRLYSPLSGLTVELSDCGWYGIEFECETFRQTDAAFKEWFHKWYDASDAGIAVEEGLSGFVHCATTVQERDGACIFSVDFGSAPVESLLELLSVLHSQGIKQLSMGTRLSQDSKRRSKA